MTRITRPANGLPTPGFDFPEYMRIPPGLYASGHGSPLRVRNKLNEEIELFNEASIEQTLRAMNDPSCQTVLGEPLKLFFSYRADEMMEMCQEYVDDPTSPTFTDISMEILWTLKRYKRDKPAKEKTRLAQASSEEEEKSKKHEIIPFAGSMKMINPTLASRCITSKPAIPDIYIETIRQNFKLPLNWFTDSKIREYTADAAYFPTKSVLPRNSGVATSVDRVDVFDMQNMSQRLLTDEEPSSFTGLTFVQALRNLLECLNVLSDNSTDPEEHTLFKEMKKHCDFFTNILDLDRALTTIYPFERMCRMDILAGRYFAPDYYELELQALLRPSYKRPYDGLDSFQPARKMPRPSSYFAISSGNVPPSYDDAWNSSESSWSASSSSHTQYSRYSGQFSGNRKPSRAALCPCCGGAHKVGEHPPSRDSSLDGKLFSRLGENLTLWTYELTPKELCLGSNLPKSCSGRHTRARAHKCSLCEGDHDAFSRDASCGRVTNGEIRP